MKHLAIIMDGNRRWAKQNGKLPILGHKAGFDNAVKISQLVAKKGIDYLTLWALSTENLNNREEEELTGIIGLIELIPGLIPVFQENKSSFHTIGDIERLPQRTQNILSEVKEKTKDFGEKKTILALVYGGQDEIVRAIKRYQQDQNKPELTVKSFESYLDSGAFPQPDLIVRTGGNIRHSGFLLYQSAYSEYFFSEKLWPDFDSVELDNAIAFFDSSKRNFGK